MRLDTSMSQRLEQKLVIAPRMIQSMEILQLPVMALQERIEHELQENPVLELKEAGLEDGEAAPNYEDDGADGPDVATATGAEEAAGDNPQTELVIEGDGGDGSDFDRLEAINEAWADHFNEETRPSSNRIDEEMDKKHDAMVNMASRPQSLQDYLGDQIAFLDATTEEM